MKKLRIPAFIAVVTLAACNNDGDRTGNVDDTALVAPPAGQRPQGAGTTDSSLNPGDSPTDTSYHIGDSLH